MKKLNMNEARLVNGGGRYYCKVCGYSNNSYSKVFWHIAKSHIPAWTTNFGNLIKSVF